MWIGDIDDWEFEGWGSGRLLVRWFDWYTGGDSNE